MVQAMMSVRKRLKGDVLSVYQNLHLSENKQVSFVCFDSVESVVARQVSALTLWAVKRLKWKKHQCMNEQVSFVSFDAVKIDVARQASASSLWTA